MFLFIFLKILPELYFSSLFMYFSANCNKIIIYFMYVLYTWKIRVIAYFAKKTYFSFIKPLFILIFLLIWNIIGVSCLKSFCAFVPFFAYSTFVSTVALSCHMRTKAEKRSNLMEITFKDITRIIKKNIVFIAVLSLLCAAASYFVTTFFVPKTYTSTV